MTVSPDNWSFRLKATVGIVSFILSQTASIVYWVVTVEKRISVVETKVEQANKYNDAQDVVLNQNLTVIRDDIRQLREDIRQNFGRKAN